MLEFTPLASSSAGCAYKVSSPGLRPLLIDCGLTYKDLQKALDFQVSGLAGCVVSHGHGDHSKAVKDLLKNGTHVFASLETWTGLGYRDHSERPHNAFVVTNGFFRCDDWIIYPFEAVHDAEGTMAFVIENPSGDRLLYLTDSCYAKYRIPDLTHIAVEANHSQELLRKNSDSGQMHRDRFRRVSMTHMSIERCIDMLKANDLTKVQEIWLLHLSDENSNEEDFKSAVERATGIPCRVAAKKGAVN